MAYRCIRCDQVHDGLPDIGHQYPDPFFDVPKDERERRVMVNSDVCSIDKEHFFIRGVLEIPILDSEQRLGFGVWVSQKKENFETYVDNYDSAEIGPFFGWLSNSIRCYEEDTFCLKSMAYFRGNDDRPVIELEPADHQLAVDQRDGITLDRAWELVHYFM